MVGRCRRSVLLVRIDLPRVLLFLQALALFSLDGADSMRRVQGLSSLPDYCYQVHPLQVFSYTQCLRHDDCRW